MQSVIVTISLVGGIASIVGLLVPTGSKFSRLIHAAYILLVTIIVGTAVYYSTAYQRLESAGRQASQLIQDREMEYTHEGYIAAGLAFLEKHRQLYPETYERAKQICVRHECNAYSTNYVGAAHEMDGLLRGISTMQTKTE